MAHNRWLSDGIQRLREAVSFLVCLTKLLMPGPTGLPKPASLASLVPWPVAMHVGVSLLGFCPIAQSQDGSQGCSLMICCQLDEAQLPLGPLPGTGIPGNMEKGREGKQKESFTEYCTGTTHTNPEKLLFLQAERPEFKFFHFL